jgi:predicted nucleic acid-binding Zn ribbon protein
VRAALERARADAQTRSSARPGRTRRRARPRVDGRRDVAGPSGDDPVPIGRLVEALIGAQSWEPELAAGRVLACWDGVAGPDVAAHCQPVSLHDGVLTLEATSTTWATQLRLLSTSLLSRIREEVGDGVVTALRIHGPAGPSWRRGALRVRGAGPRDTYG